MKTSNRLMLACEGVMTKKVRTFMLGIGVSVGTAALIFLVSLIFGAKAYVDEKVGGIRENLLNVGVKPPPPHNPQPLDDSAYRQLLQIKGETGAVVDVYRELPIAPRPYIKVKNQPANNWLKVVSVDEGLYQNNPDNPIPDFKYRHVEPVDESEITFPEADETEATEEEEDTNFIPVLVPNVFVEALTSFAGDQRASLKQFFDILQGQEPFYILVQGKGYRCKVVAVDNTVSSWSIAVPFRYGEEWNRHQGEQFPGYKQPDYDRFVVEATDIKHLDDIKEKITAAGYQPQPTDAQEIGIAVSRGAMYLFLLAVTFCLVIALVSAIGIFNGLSISIMEQAPRIGILRSVGATRADISSIYLFEAAIIGIVGGVIGLVAAHLLMWGSDIALKDFLSDATNIRDIVTLFAWGLPEAFYIRTGAVGLGVITSLLAGVGPAYRASCLNPAVVLREG